MAHARETHHQATTPTNQMNQVVTKAAYIDTTVPKAMRMHILVNGFLASLCLWNVSARRTQSDSPSPAPPPWLWPAPQFASFTTEESRIVRTVSLAEGLDFDYVRRYDPRVMNVLEQARSRFLTGLLRSIPRDASRRPINPRHKTIWTLKGIHISITDTSDDDGDLKHDVSESYRLEVRPPMDNDDYMILEAPTVYGILHGLQTLQQLLPFAWGAKEDEHAPVYTVSGAPFVIVDYPIFPHRGLLMDTSRHYLPLDLILRNLDALAMNKMNVLHWHMVDSPSWPYQSEVFPELSAKGAYCGDCVYTPAQIGVVVREAALRGIRVIPEFDLPGHSQAIGASHPEWLTACRGGRRSEPLDVTRSQVYSFVYRLYDEINATFVDDWIHIGGDEVSTDCWKENKAIQKWKLLHNMTRDEEILQYFETKLITYVDKKIKKRPIVWQELFDSGLDIPKSVVVDVWKEWMRNETVYKATAEGMVVLMSSCWYLDHLDKDVAQFYQCDPLNFNGTMAQKKLVAGGHASMWGERVDETNFFPRVWPRTSAVAEKLWTGESAEARATYLSRLDHFRCYLIEQGIPASPLGPGSCSASWNGDEPLTTDHDMPTFSM